MEPGLRKGQLIKWKDDRGFGFIQPMHGGKEVFLHISDIKQATRRPQMGDTIYFHTTTDQDGKIRACHAFISGGRSKPVATSTSGGKTTSNPSAPLSFLLLSTLLLSSLPLAGSIHFIWKTGNPIPLILYPAMSWMTYVLYADDKFRAKRGHWRTSEKRLHLCELAGGWIGGFIAQQKLRHKTIKSSYQMVFWVIVLFHLAFWFAWLGTGGSLFKVFSLHFK